MTMRQVIIGVCLLGLCAAAPACSPSEDPPVEVQRKHRFQLTKPAHTDRHEPTTSEQAWRASLVRNLGHRGEVLTFARANVQLLDEGTPRDGLVFVNLSNDQQYLVRKEQSVIVDYGVSEIGTSGTDGISFHPHPAGRIVVVLIPTRGVSVLGVCLSTPKCGTTSFAFRGREAAWDW